MRSLHQDLDICRYSPRSKNGEPNFVLAKTIIHADKDEVREFAFGYSDIINVFINNQIFSVIADRLNKSHAPKYFNIAINAGEITNEDITIKEAEKVCVVSIAL